MDKTRLLMDYLEVLLTIQEQGEINCNAKIKTVLEAIDESFGFKKSTGGIFKGINLNNTDIIGVSPFEHIKPLSTFKEKDSE